MSERTSSRYEELYPKTVASQISDVYSKSETSNLFLPKSGGSMGGILDMSGNKITNLANPTESLDSANKKYVDDSQMFEIITVKSGILNDSGKRFNHFAMNNITTNQYLRIVGFKFDFNIPADSSSSYFGISFGTSSNTIPFYYLQQRNVNLARTAKFCIFASNYKENGSNDYPSPMFEYGNASAEMAGLSRGSVPYLYINSEAYSQNITGSISAILLR